MDRRKFLSLFGLGLLTSLVPFGLKGWAMSPVSSDNTLLTSRKKLIVLLQRGGVDGLSAVIPHNEAAYYDARPTVAIAPPGTSLSGLNLDGSFSLHPALESVLPLWNYKTLAFTHACGTPTVLQSHLEAQREVETGISGNHTDVKGWLNRLLEILAQSEKGTHGISMGSSTPLILQGNIVAGTLSSSNAPSSPPFNTMTLSTHYDELYKKDRQLGEVYQEVLLKRERLIADLDKEDLEASRGAPSPINFHSNCKRLAKTMARDPTMQVAFLDVGNWDSHVNQGGASGMLARHLKAFGQGIAALATGLGPTYNDTLILVISEFGRTVQENSLGGTDHGHGNVLWALGGQVQGGRVYGEWPGLKQHLAVTTDFRQAIGEHLQRHFRLSGSQLTHIFPQGFLEKKSASQSP